MTTASISAARTILQRTPAVSAIAIFACVLLWAVLFARMTDRNLSVDKDYLYVYLCGAEIMHPTLHDQQIDLVKGLVSISAPDQFVYRATLRANYCNNYPFTSLSMYAAGNLLTVLGFADPAKDYVTFLSRAMWWGTLLSGLLLGVACLVVSFGMTSGTLRVATLAALAIGALLYVVVPPPILNWLFVQTTPSPPDRLVNWSNILGVSLYSWLNPAPQNSIFSNFARCLCAMLSFGAFTTRWSGRQGLAYWIPLLVSVVHQSTALILLVVMLCCDIAIRPKSLARAACIVPIASTIVLIGARERMFAILGLNWSAATTALLIALGLGILLLLPAVRRAVGGVSARIADWRRTTLEQAPAPLTDTIVIITLWLGILLISYFVAKNDVWYRVIYFWSELSPRYIGMFQLSVIVGLTYPAWDALLRDRVDRQKVAMAAITIVALAVTASQSTKGWVALDNLRNGSQRFEEVTVRNNAHSGPLQSFGSEETAWYYLMLRRAIIGGKDITTFLGVT
ncbi:hypothetical protein [Bradyrhizobium lablabi]|uniref:hypothetical protein n=1 Tax=Bradyrhizobium lablabi TaxID=722472 RepID=UPI001BACA2F3|nr:hypothetical protein [Bradyrhizobium lablabi]MBR0695283.1 hypothetical protein [Bradyrhizobium lablabi]